MKFFVSCFLFLTFLIPGFSNEIPVNDFKKTNLKKIIRDEVQRNEIRLVIASELIKESKVTKVAKSSKVIKNAKSCPCSSQCTCGCNNGQDCKCNTQTYISQETY